MISVIPRRYAQALLMIATERQTMEQYEQELARFRQVLLENPQVKELLDNPRVLPQEKKKALDLLIKDFASPIVYNFLHLILDKRREAFFLEVIKAYNKYADEARNIVNAEVWSVVELTSKDYRDLEQKLARITGKSVRLQNIIDTSLLGGIKVKIGDMVIDGSVTKKLSLLKNQLQRTQLTEIGVKK
ncbi:MAG: F0F1 ATP synthase subunit delta [Clostridia bacterium]|nr:F0F1 ATP synthase subunit delta [Clostridia bacterium]MDD4146314.1 F0F1 ATP synthase subunit delta [Clostridia bacterium]MDD4665823.1 F0F1 ATP synthase subunit delta [Clostridia bacterium]